MSEVNVRQPEFFEKMNELLTSVPLDQWKTYLRWQLVNSTASRLSAPFVEENFNFSRGLTGQQVLQPRWKRCVSATDAALGDALGQLYVKKVFPPESKDRIQVLISNLLAAYRERLMNAEWLGDTTRKQALAKLEVMGQKLGYPNKWKTYTAVELKPDTYLENSFHLASFEDKRNLAKIGKQIDRTEWGLTASSVNAYYYPPSNEIVFPAAILQPPVFDPKADEAVNYGAIGAIIGHEITHAFDDVGSAFDAAGNLRNWWTEEDRNKFTERASCVERQFSSYEIEKGLFINGKLTLGENISDLGGLNAALAAYRKSLKGKSNSEKINGFTPQQRFFIGYAQVWAALQRPEYERLQINRSQHSAPRFRVNGPLSNMPEFAEAFACRLGDAMFRPVRERCRVW
jgi:putative endopeptidase